MAYNPNANHSNQIQFFIIFSVNNLNHTFTRLNIAIAYEKKYGKFDLKSKVTLVNSSLDLFCIIRFF